MRLSGRFSTHRSYIPARTFPSGRAAQALLVAEGLEVYIAHRASALPLNELPVLAQRLLCRVTVSPRSPARSPPPVVCPTARTRLAAADAPESHAQVFNPEPNASGMRFSTDVARVTDDRSQTINH
jgi:hypothetical protein